MLTSNPVARTPRKGLTPDAIVSLSVSRRQELVVETGTNAYDYRKKVGVNITISHGKI